MKNEAKKYGISLSNWGRIQKIFKDFPKLKDAILFGSRAIGNYRPGSDIDIAMKGYNLKLDDILSSSLKLDSLNLPYKFGLIIYDRIKENALKNHIDKLGKYIYNCEEFSKLES